MDITELLAFSAKQGASDLHLSAGLPPMKRVDGDRSEERRVGQVCMNRLKVQTIK